MSDDRHVPNPAAGAPDTGRDRPDIVLPGPLPGDAASSDPGSAPGPRADDLSRVIADDLRVPAAVLAREVRELARTPPDALPQRARRALSAIAEQSRVVASLSTRLRELEHLDHADPRAMERPIELVSLVAGVVSARADEARVAGIRLEAVSGERPVFLPADPERLARAVDAAIEGMWRAVGRGGAVRVLVQATADGARIDVEGRPSHRSRRRRPPRLAGAALAVARKIAALHGGALEVIEDAGTISARLALRTASGHLPQGDPHRSEATSSSKARILVVDDDQDAREALSMILGDDHDVRLAADGHEALQSAMEHRPSIVLMDLYMPRMDGLAALEALRAEPTTEDVPVILISARGDEITRSRCLDLGAVDFLQKPFSGRELRSRIDRTLRLTRRETELQTLARTDPLTGLANLRAFRLRLDEEVKRARRYHTSLACVMVDMDNLKPINDGYGHAAGDQALRALADVLRRELRETDFGARYGGDEFVLLLPHTSGAEARVFAERVCARLAASPIEVQGAAVAVGASFGISALVDDGAERPGETLVSRADAALYAAKRAGRGRVSSHPSAQGNLLPPLA